MHKNYYLYCFMTFICLAFSFLLVKLFDVTILSKKKIHKYTFHNQTVHRKNIVDRNGTILATDLVVYSLYTNPRKIKNPKLMAERLKIALSDVPYEKIYKALSATNTSFSWIKKNITPKEKLILDELGLAGIYFEKNYKRIYLTENIFSHLIGYVDVDNFGIAGMELFLNKKSDNIKDKLELSVDIRVQTVMHDKIQEAVLEYKAEGAAGIILDAKNGEVVSLLSLPDFNPNYIQKYTDNEKFNRATLGVYEFGSVVKMFTIAAALDSDVIELDDTFTIEDKLKIGNHTITDYRKSKRSSLSVTEIITTSSNIGMVKTALKLGGAKQKEYFQRFGIFSPLKIEIPEKAQSLVPKKWDDIASATASYGYGIATTLLHITQAFGALVNGGCLYQATLIKNNNSSCSDILTSETSEKIRSLLASVVKDGTGKLAYSLDYDIGGKTGSAEKIVNGKYQKYSNIVSFIATFPIHNPRYVIAIMVDGPKSTKSVTGGTVVAPIIKKVIDRISPILGIEPSF